MSSAEDPRLVRFTRICFGLPETSRDYNGQHAAFLVRGKKFAYFLNDHHRDGIVAMTCKVLPGDNENLSKANPRKFYIPAYLGPRGWVAMRLDVGRVDWTEVKALVTWSYQRTAPRRLAAMV